MLIKIYIGNRDQRLKGWWCCVYYYIYCKSDNIREVLIFANFAKRISSRIQEPRENYYYNSVTEEK